MIKPRNVLTVFTKEFLSFFNSPVAYIVLTVFLLVTGWLFFQQLFVAGQASMRGLFGLIPIMFIFFAPAITMRLIAEERKTNTIGLLLTLPITNVEMMLGKFFAAWGLLGVALGLTFPFALTVASAGPMDWGPVFGGYIGAMLMGAAYLSIGMFSTSLTSNQIIAFIIGLALSFVFFIIDKVLMFMPESLATFLQYISVDYHFRNIARGVLDLRDLMFYLTFCGAFLTYSVYAVQREEWR